MTLHEVPVPFEEKAELASLMRAYVAEMEQIIGLPPGDGGYPRFDLYWTEPNARWPFWLKVDDTNAGFALVRRNLDLARMEMAEFFVMPEFRGRGIGLAGARRLIGRHPGHWRITQRENNSGAIGFWNRVLDGFVVYEETTTTTDVVRREQRFVFL
jgi:predicted acetyltransferase